jgi:hypothetical protein
VLASNGTGYEGRTISVVPFSGLTLTPGTGSIVFGLDPALINITSLGGVLTVAKGGTGLSGAPANGSLLIGNGVAYANTTLTAGTGISITNGAGTITIANTATGVSQLNNLTGNLDMSFGTAATTPTVVASGSDIFLNIPNAGASPVTRGLLTAADWTTFNNKVSSTGTTNYIPKFTAAGTVGNSVLYEDGIGNIGLGTTTPTAKFHIRASSSTFLVETTSGAAATIRASSSSASTSATLNSGGNLTTVNTDFTVNTAFKVYPTGNVQVSKGFALNGLVYWNTASNYIFASNEQYGVILGPTSPNTMTVTLPTTPMDGQEICILIEENKTLTVDSGVALRNIYGQAATPATSVTLNISLNTHGSVYIFKFLGAGNGGVGAWYLTGL